MRSTHDDIEPGNSEPIVVSLEGELDLWTQQSTRTLLQPLASCRYGILDLRAARIGDATFLGDLAMLYRANLAAGGAIVLVASNAHAKRILEIVQFDELFPVVASIGEARALVEAHATVARAR